MAKVKPIEIELLLKSDINISELVEEIRRLLQYDKELNRLQKGMTYIGSGKIFRYYEERIELYLHARAQELSEAIKLVKEKGDKLNDEEKTLIKNVTEYWQNTMGVGTDLKENELLIKLDNNRNQVNSMFESYKRRYISKYINTYLKNDQTELSGTKKEIYDDLIEETKRYQKQVDTLHKAIRNNLNGKNPDTVEVNLNKTKLPEVYITRQSRKKDTERLYKELTDEYQSYTDKRLEIERKHNEDIAALEQARARATKGGDMEAAARIERSIGEAIKSKGRALMSHDLEVLRQSPEYVRAYEDLGNSSNETLQGLLGQLERLKGTAASVLDPQDMREYTSTIQGIMDELDSRDTLGALSRRVEELAAAQRELLEAKKQLDIVNNGGKILKGLKVEGMDANGKPIVAASYLSAGEAMAKYTEAKDKHTKASNRYIKAEKEARDNVARLTDAIKELGTAIGGEAGEVVELVMDVGVFISDTIEGIKTVQKVGVEAVSAVEKASIILTIISTAVRLLQKISELGNNKAFKEYEAYAEKIKEINALTDSVNEYRLAVLEARQEENTWFATDSLKNLKQWRDYHDEVYKAYVDKAMEAQAVYRNESGGGWLTGALNWVMANLSILGWWDEWRDLWGQGGYEKGMTAAIANLRIETRKKSSGFLGTGIGGHSQKTEDLESWARRNGFGELFDDKGLINKELAQIILDEYGGKLVGQTKETLEALIELREKYDEYIEQLHEYVSSMYEPIVDNFVDSIWDWFDNGKDALDSFKAYASDTFRAIVSDMLRTIVLDKVVGSYSDDVSALYEKYAEGKLNEESLMAEIADLTEELIGRYGNNIPTLEGILSSVAGMLDNAGIDLRQPESSGSGQTGRGGAYTAMTQDQGTKLEGLMVSVQGHVANIDRVAEDTGAKMSRAESLLQKIEENTGVSAGTLKELKTMVEKMLRDGIKTR